jgi:hypothetical protein
VGTLIHRKRLCPARKRVKTPAGIYWSRARSLRNIIAVGGMRHEHPDGDREAPGARQNLTKHTVRRTDSVISLVLQPEPIERPLARVVDTVTMNPRQLNFWQLPSCVANQEQAGHLFVTAVDHPAKCRDRILRGEVAKPGRRAAFCYCRMARTDISVEKSICMCCMQQSCGG